MKNLSYIKIFWFFILILFTSFSNLLSQRRDVESDIRYKQASAYYRSGSYERAIPLFNKALKENPHHRGAFEKLIQVYLRIRKADSIEVLTTRFSENNKLRFSDYMAVAASKIIKGNKKEALRFIDKHIEERRQNKKLKPNDIQNAAFMLQRYRMTDEALSYFETGIKYFPKASYFYTSMADIYKQQMKYSAATGAYLQFLVSKPDGLKTVSSRIMSMKTSSEQKEEIGKTIQSFIKKYSDNKNLVQLYIEFKIRNQDYNSAIQLVEKSIPKDERLPHIIKIAGEMGSNSEALEAIELLEKYNIKLKDKDNYRLNLQLIELYAVEFKESHTTDWLEKIDLLLKKLNKLNEGKTEGNKSFWDLKFKQLSILLENRYDVDNCIKLAENLLGNTKKTAQKNQLYLYLGKAYRLKNNLKKSSIYYTKAVKQKKYNKSAGFELLMNDFYCFKWDSLNKEIGKIFPKIALKDTIANNYLQLKQYLTLNYPDEESRRLFALALLKKEQGSLSEAFTIFNVIISKSQGYFKSYCSIINGDIAKRTGLQKEAMEIYQSIISDSVMVERHEDAMFFLAGILENIPEKNNEAEELYFELLEMYPAGRFADKTRERLKKMQESKDNVER